MTLICKDCKHHIKVKYGYGLNLTRICCTRNSKVNLITGNKYDFLECDDERTEISATPNRCGIIGKYWEKYNG